MKIKIEEAWKKEYEVPDGDYCQKSDGSVSCEYYCYDIDPIFGTTFYCRAFGHTFDVPYDNKQICAKRDIKKCEKCINLCKIGGIK